MKFPTCDKDFLKSFVPEIAKPLLHYYESRLSLQAQKNLTTAAKNFTTG